jgi:hypothetical protein
MKTKIWVGVLFYSFLGCANKAPKSNLTSKILLLTNLQACKSLKP